MKGMMHRLQRGVLTVLLATQALGGGAVTLAHARDAVTAPAAFEAQHDARCLVLHDALRCALCHYASAQVVVQRAVITPPSRPTRRSSDLPAACGAPSTAPRQSELHRLSCPKRVGRALRMPR